MKTNNWMTVPENANIDSLNVARVKRAVNAELQAKCLRENLLVNGAFKASLLKVQFEFAIAQSVFTHLPLNSIRRCFVELFYNDI